ncbi:MAG TPA: heavy metal-binding domain-containing protein, partial [Candidatus Thermoplasmatota archaeon]|nr:heavy metal-binding domain-containing protein [Candidatus Thermoplasmatota archaeon]
MVLVVTTEHVPGRDIAQTLGLVQASAVRSRHIGSDVGAAL